MYSLTFCLRVMLPERHQWKPAVQAAAVMLRRPPVDGQSPASQLGGIPCHYSKLHPGPCSSVGMRLRADRHTDAPRDHNTFCVIYDSCKM